MMKTDLVFRTVGERTEELALELAIKKAFELGIYSEYTLQAEEALKKHLWPGNIRELRHTIEKAVILSSGNMLKSDDFMLKQGSSINLRSGLLQTCPESRSSTTWPRMKKCVHAGRPLVASVRTPAKSLIMCRPKCR